MTAAVGSRGRTRGRAVTLALAVALLAALVAALWFGIGAIEHAPLYVHIDGEEVLGGLDLASLPPMQQAGLVGGLLVALLLVLAAVPLVLTFALVGALLILLAAVGLPLLAMLTVAGVLLSPIALVVWLIWRASRSAPNIRA